VAEWGEVGLRVEAGRGMIEGEGRGLKGTGWAR
jgi:hypothetical protein